MFWRVSRRFALVVLFLVLLGIGASASLKGPTLAALQPGSLAISVSAAGTGCSTVYAVTNSSASAASYVHDFKNSSGAVEYSFSDNLAGNTTKSYDARTLQGLRDGFVGSLTISSDQPLSALISDVAGCDSLKYAAVMPSSTLPATLEAGQTITVQVNLKNNSTVFPWPAGGPNPVRVGYRWYQGGNLLGQLDDGNRGILPSDVPPGGTVTVDVPVRIPLAVGTATIWFDIVHEGISWFGSQNVGPYGFNSNLVSSFTKLVWGTAVPPAYLTPGQTINVSIPVTNTSSSFVWQSGGANPVHVGSHWVRADGTMAVWDGERGTLPGDVQPGQSVVVSVPVRAPSVPGDYTIWFDLVQEGVTWFGAFNAPSFGANVAVGYEYTKVWYDPAATPSTLTLAPNQSLNVPVRVKNTSTSFNWTSGGSTPINVGSHWAVPNGPILVWDGLRGPLPGDVAPGQTVTVNVPVRAPATPGDYVIWFDLVQETVTWFGAYNAPSLGVAVRVSSAKYTSVRYDPTKTPSTLSLSPGQSTNVSVTVTNTSTEFTWNAGGATPINIGSHWAVPNGPILVWDGLRGPLPGNVGPGQTVTVSVPVTAPTTPGDYVIWFDLVEETVTWFGAYNAPSLGVGVSVR